jgi:hypothetical protein
VTGHQQRGPFVLGVVSADDQLTAGVKFTRRGERDGERQRRAGTQRRRERVADEPELGAALASTAALVVVVAEIAPARVGIFAMARFGVFRLAGPVLMVMVVMLVVVVVVMLAAWMATARRVIAPAA